MPAAARTWRTVVRRLVRFGIIGRCSNAEHAPLCAEEIKLATIRSDGTRQSFPLVAKGAYLESYDTIPKPHGFEVELIVAQARHTACFEEHDYGARDHHRDNNMRAAIIHVAADAAVSVLVIAGLILARVFGWVWMDPLAGIVGALVIASWSYSPCRRATSDTFALGSRLSVMIRARA